MNDDGLGDWRLRAVTTLTQDLPATPLGAPAHKAGARVALSTTMRAPNGEIVGFVTPSAPAMALSLAMKSVDQAEAIRASLEFSDSVSPEGRAKSIFQEGELVDFFEHCMVITVFSFQALESYCNQTIGDDMKEPIQLDRKRQRRGQELILNTVADVERIATTEEKLAVVVPKLLGITSPRGKAVWGQFLMLKQARDATVHLKSVDQYPSRKERGFVDETSLFYQFLYQDMSQYPKAAVSMIHYFAHRTVVPRWLEPQLEKYDLK
jgi:hypothetical protein